MINNVKDEATCGSRWMEADQLFKGNLAGNINNIITFKGSPGNWFEVWYIVKFPDSKFGESNILKGRII